MSDRTIELSTNIEAPPDRVFRALTDADELTRWFPSSAESDPRPGGAFSYRFEFDDAAKDHTYEGEYLDVSANERVAYPWQARLGTTEVELTVRPSGAGAEVRLAHSGWGEGGEWDASVEMHREGWGFFLANLKAYVEGGADGRAEAMGMKTPAAARGG
jgi:uncharacterized protein YndB with AHSA1/START domain